MAVGYGYETLPTFPEVRRGHWYELEETMKRARDQLIVDRAIGQGLVNEAFRRKYEEGNIVKEDMEFFEGRRVVPTGEERVPERGELYKYHTGVISKAVCASGTYPIYKFADEVDVDIRGFWMVIRGSGPGAGQTQKRHYSGSEAMREAERLTRETGVGFFVLRTDLYVEPETPPVRWRQVL